ncbi:MAG: hypothetical protein ACM3ML_35545 [Micromonosporaceae bacterium]
MAATAIYLESGKKRVFACSFEWPGWCRSGKGEEAAIEALSAYVPRYAPVVTLAGAEFPADAAAAFDVAERVAGSATTDFGAPGAIPAADREPLAGDRAVELAALVRASWRYFDDVVAGAPAELRKGPRGGGRDRDKIVDHVLGAEMAYARKIGLRLPQPAIGDVAAIAAERDEVAAVLSAPSDGAPPVERGWPVRYAIRRIAWHVLDHAWEIQDRSSS